MNIAPTLALRFNGESLNRLPRQSQGRGGS